MPWIVFKHAIPPAKEMEEGKIMFFKFNEDGKTDKRFIRNYEPKDILKPDAENGGLRDDLPEYWAYMPEAQVLPDPESPPTEGEGHINCKLQQEEEVIPDLDQEEIDAAKQRAKES